MWGYMWRICPKLSWCFSSLMIVIPVQRCLQGYNLVRFSDPFLWWSCTGARVPGTTKWITFICQGKWWWISYYQQSYLPRPIFTKGSFFWGTLYINNTLWTGHISTNTAWQSKCQSTAISVILDQYNWESDVKEKVRWGPEFDFITDPNSWQFWENPSRKSGRFWT